MTSTRRVNFPEINFHATKTGVCPSCGKIASRSKRFWQTLNPFNVNPEGGEKSAIEIRRELKKEADEWIAMPVFHLKCERGVTTGRSR